MSKNEMIDHTSKEKIHGVVTCKWTMHVHERFSKV